MEMWSISTHLTNIRPNIIRIIISRQTTGNNSNIDSLFTITTTIREDKMLLNLFDFLTII